MEEVLQEVVQLHQGCDTKTAALAAEANAAQVCYYILLLLGRGE